MRLVSDHAIIRYLQRARGLDLEAVEAEILQPEVLSALKSGAASLKKNGFTFIFDRGRIITVLDSTKRGNTRGRAA